MDCTTEQPGREDCGEAVQENTGAGGELKPGVFGAGGELKFGTFGAGEKMTPGTLVEDYVLVFEMKGHWVEMMESLR